MSAVSQAAGLYGLMPGRNCHLGAGPHRLVILILESALGLSSGWSCHSLGAENTADAVVLIGSYRLSAKIGHSFSEKASDANAGACL